MNTTLMALVSLGIVVGLFVVLVGFVNHLSGVLRRTGNNLGRALDITVAIRHDCETVESGVQAMNMNLYRVAAALSNVGDATEERAASVTVPVAEPPANGAAHSATGA